MSLRSTIKAGPRSPDKCHKKYAHYIAQDIDGSILTARTMRSLCELLNREREPTEYVYSQHLYRVASGLQLSPHKGVDVRRIDSDDVYDQWKRDWVSKNGAIKLELF